MMNSGAVGAGYCILYDGQKNATMLMGENAESCNRLKE